MTNTQGLADELAARAASLDRHEWFRPQYLLGLASTFREWDFADMWGRPEEAELAARYMETAFIDLTALRSEAAGQENLRNAELRGYRRGVRDAAGVADAHDSRGDTGRGILKALLPAKHPFPVTPETHAHTESKSQ